MKKLIAVLVVLGLVLSIGAGSYVSASAEDYAAIPDPTLLAPR